MILIMAEEMLKYHGQTYGYGSLIIEQWWSTLPASTQIYYWGYICFILGVLTIEVCNYLIPKVKEAYGIE